MNKRIVDRLRADVVSASLTGWRKAVYIVMLTTRAPVPPRSQRP
jgi:hypothetical protein